MPKGDPRSILRAENRAAWTRTKQREAQNRARAFFALCPQPRHLIPPRLAGQAVRAVVFTCATCQANEAVVLDVVLADRTLHITRGEAEHYARTIHGWVKRRGTAWTCPVCVEKAAVAA